MSKLNYKTVSAKKEDINPSWWIVDAEDLVLGRMSSRIAHVLRGKHHPYFTPHVDCGDYVVVLNADKVRLTGNKWNDKVYMNYSGYPGGLKKRTALQIKAKNPTEIVERAVRGMLPKNRLGRQVFKKLFVYKGAEHPHQAQKPQELKLDL